VILYGASDNNRRLHLGKIYARDVALSIFLFVGCAAYSLGQLPTSAAPVPAKAESATPVDPLGREAPRSAMMGLLKYEQLDDYETAALYLQPTPRLSQ